MLITNLDLGRGASRDVGGESQRIPGLYLGIASLVTNWVKRLNPYLRARPCPDPDSWSSPLRFVRQGRLF